MDNLCSIALLERDQFGDVLQTWVYPSLPAGISELLPSKSGLESNNVSTQHIYSRFRDHWIYIYTTTDKFEGLPQVKALGVVLTSKVFNPEKFAALLPLLAQVYGASGNTGNLLQAYLAVLTKESFTFGQNGTFELAKFDDRRAMLTGQLKELISTFGMETVLILTAVLIKKRILVYSSRLDVLQKLLRVMPMFAAHRQNWSILRPYVHLNEAEIAELNMTAVYAAGTLDESAETNENLFDLFVDADDRSVTVATHAKNDFMMGKPHKDLAQFLVAAAEDAEKTDAQVAKLLAQRIQQILAQLQTLIPEGKALISVADIRSKEMPVALQRFMWNIAVAENMAEI